VVIWLHGTGSSKDDMRQFLRHYADRGAIACAVDTRYHGKRGTPASYTAALQQAWATGDERPFIYDSVFPSFPFTIHSGLYNVFPSVVLFFFIFAWILPSFVSFTSLPSFFS
jgi:hypothetical protein